MTEPETNSEDKKDDESTTKDENAEQATTADSAPKSDEGCSEPSAVAGDAPTPARSDSSEPTPEMAGDDTTKEPGTSEPKQAVFPPIDPAAGSAATVAEEENAGEIVS